MCMAQNLHCWTWAAAEECCFVHNQGLHQWTSVAPATYRLSGLGLLLPKDLRWPLAHSPSWLLSDVMLDSATHTTNLSTDVDASTYLNAHCRLRAVLVAALHTNCTLFLPQGAQWAKAAEVFEQMKVNRCNPDVVTYTALVSAYERGGQWMKALEAFTQMQRQPNCNADAILYNTLLDVLWDTGVPWAQHQAAALFRVAVDEGHFRKLPMPNQPQRPYATETLLQPPGAAAAAAAAAASSEAAGTDSASGSPTAAQASGPGGPGSRLELGMQGVSPGVAMLMLHCWLADLRCVLLVLTALFMLGCVV